MTENCSKEKIRFKDKISILNTIITFLLCVFAGYSVYVSNNISKITSQEYQRHIWPNITLNIISANMNSGGGVLVNIGLNNKGNNYISLEETRVFIIDFPYFKETSNVKILKESKLEYETVLLPSQSETHNWYDINKDGFEMIKDKKAGILEKTRFSSISNKEYVLFIVRFYSKKNDLNQFSTYKMWLE